MNTYPEIQLKNTTTEISTMSHLNYYNYEGLGKTNQQKYKYSQAVRVGDRIEIAGQGTFLFWLYFCI